MTEAVDRALAFDTAVNAARLVRASTVKDCLAAVDEAERTVKMEHNRFFFEEDHRLFQEVRRRISGLLPTEIEEPS